MNATEKKQLRKMDDATLLHVAKVSERCLEESTTNGDKALVAYWHGKVDAVKAEKARRAASEA